MKDHKYIFILLFALILLLAPIVIPSGSEEKESEPYTTDVTSTPQNEFKTIMINNRPEITIKAEIADTAEERSRGLMFRKDLDKTSGMLFLFEDETIPHFWMKNTPLSLDILFIDKNRKITDIFSRTEPLQTHTTYSPKQEILYVLEVNAGWAEENNVRPGDEILFDNQI